MALEKITEIKGRGVYVAGNEIDTDRIIPARFMKCVTFDGLGENFGCGSSREHAPQALYRYGFRGLIAESYAEIFFGNCTTLGIPCFCATKEDIKAIVAAVEVDPSIEITLDVANERISYGDQSVTAVVRDSARMALCEGKWDMIGELREAESRITEVAGALPYMAK